MKDLPLSESDGWTEVLSLALSPRPANERLPWLLRMMGEKGNRSVIIRIPKEDAHPTATDSSNYEVMSSQRDIARARRLFPEATVFAYFNNTHNAVRAFVKDKADHDD